MGLREAVVIRRMELESGAIEEALCQIADIEAARVVFNGADTIEELHILALPNKGPKQILRDVESTLMARFGIDVDHKKISIAQLGSNGNGYKKSGSRPKLLSVHTEVTDLNIKVKVDVQLDEKTFVGTAEGIASQSGRLRLAAEAALRAIEDSRLGNFRSSLEDVAVVKLGAATVAVACVTIIAPGDEARFCGSVIVKNSEVDAVVKATLASVNRRFGI